MAGRGFNAPRRRSQPARGFANPLRSMSADVRRATGEALRSATRQIISDLQEEGPNYSGKFRSKWYSQVEGRGNKVFASVGVPRFTDEQLKRGTPAIVIGNTSPYAQEAMDLIPGKFIRQEADPNKAPVSMGKRTGALRGQVQDMSLDEIVEAGGKPAISTAEYEWYTQYMEGGRFDQAFKQGAKSGFIRPAIK